MKKRTLKKIIGLMLVMVLLIVPCSNTAMALDEQISTGEVVSQTTEYSSGNWIEADAIIPNPDYVTSESTLTQRTETAETLSTTSTVLADGVYRIRNVANGKYMDTNGGGSAAGTAIVQWDKSEYIADSDVVNLNQLFKVTYLGTSGSKEYYSIRPMTNNEMGVSAPKSSASNTVDIQSISTSETFSSIPWYQKWSIASNGSYYTIENTYVSANTYLSTPSTSTNGLQMIMVSTLSTNSKWVFEAYTDSVDNMGMINFTTGVAKGYTFDFDAVMSSSTIGRNGGITYSVRNTDGTATDKATINSSTGVLTALEEGCIQIATTYTNAPWIWLWNVQIGPADGMYMIMNKERDFYIQIDDGGENFIETSLIDGGKSQKWNISYVDNGYYTLQNVNNGLFMTAPADETIGAYITLETYMSSLMERQLWTFIWREDGSYEIQSKSCADTGIVLAYEWYSSAEGEIQQKEYTDDDNYQDEWILYSYRNYSHIYMGNPSAIDGTPDPLMPAILENVENAFINNGYTSGYGSTSCDENDLLVQLSMVDVFSIITHGAQTILELTGVYKFEIDSIKAMSGDAFENLRFVYLGACETGKGQHEEDNLVNSIYDKGADAVLGFYIEVNVEQTDFWTEKFMVYIAQGYSIGEAINKADGDLRISGIQIDENDQTYDVFSRYFLGDYDMIPCP